jgi:hypothetical protein
MERSLIFDEWKLGERRVCATFFLRFRTSPLKAKEALSGPPVLGMGFGAAVEAAHSSQNQA